VTLLSNTVRGGALKALRIFSVPVPVMRPAPPISTSRVSGKVTVPAPSGKGSVMLKALLKLFSTWSSERHFARLWQAAASSLFVNDPDAGEPLRSCPGASAPKQADVRTKMKTTKINWPGHFMITTLMRFILQDARGVNVNALETIKIAQQRKLWIWTSPLPHQTLLLMYVCYGTASWSRSMMDWIII
jgi:hypothetical protein